MLWTHSREFGIEARAGCEVVAELLACDVMWRYVREALLLMSTSYATYAYWTAAIGRAMDG